MLTAIVPDRLFYGYNMDYTKAGILRNLILGGMRMTTREMCVFLGWQGGTIHQVAIETGLTVNQLLEAQQ